MNKLVNFESLIGKTIYVVPINYSKEKDYIVVSHREYLKALVPQEMEKLIIAQKYNGFVTGTSRHGVFVEFNGCLTGLIAKSDIGTGTIVGSAIFNVLFIIGVCALAAKSVTNMHF
jgi:ribosomal protein S1